MNWKEKTGITYFLQLKVLVDSIVANQEGRVSGFSKELVAGQAAFAVASYVAAPLGIWRLAGNLGILPAEAGAPPSYIPQHILKTSYANLLQTKVHLFGLSSLNSFLFLPLQP